jgi:hypothetical protein
MVSLFLSKLQLTGSLEVFETCGCVENVVDWHFETGTDLLRELIAQRLED